MSDVKECLELMRRKFNERAKTDEKFKKELKGRSRKVLIEVTDGDSFNFSLKDCQIGPLNKGKCDKADISVTSDTATLVGLFEGTVKPMKAWATKKIKVKAKMADLLTLQKFLK